MTAKKNNTNKSLQQKQELAEALLKKKGIDLNEWLEKQFEKVIYENLDVLKQGLDATTSIKN